MMRKTTAIDLTGQKFNRLTAMSPIPGTKHVERRWVNGSPKNVMEVARAVGLSKTAAQYFYTLAFKLKEHYGFLPTP